MTTVVPGRRPLDQDADSSARAFSGKPSLHPIQRSHPVSSVQDGAQLILEPPSKRRKLSNDPLATDVSNNRFVANFPTNTNSPLSHLNADSLGINVNRQPVITAHCRTTQFPSRPNDDRHRSASVNHSSSSGGPPPLSPTVSVKPYMSETPSLAPQYPKSCPADFFPWAGCHAEDVLNESTARNGFYDKLPASYSESGTARPSLWSGVKTKGSLRLLSDLLLSALHKRQEQGRLTKSSSFKPPPRVTLTDAKKESWLKDLSNPAIPLRRLSRTIPHGIRGKILLEQCLRKEVPITRAIWLAKCVGANEIRAFKRKGANTVFSVGGEAKWIKEWTTNIEQFLRSLFNDCDGMTWRVQGDYGIRLAVHLFSEHLLDRDQYLDWVIDSTANSDLEMLASWLLLASAHLSELFSKRRRGKRMIKVLLSHLELAAQPTSRQAYKSLVQDLVDILQTAIASHPACLLIPNHWNKYEKLIRNHVIRDHLNLYTQFTHLHRRNLKLQDHSSRNLHHNQSSSQQSIIALFDNLSAVLDFKSVAQRCFRMTTDPKQIVACCLKWCSSVDRHGAHRIYVAARLMRLWAKHGVDVQGHILDFLRSALEIQGLHKPDIYRLISELVCSGHFSIGRYLQWLMAHGGVSEAQTSTADGPCHLRLLFELPIHNLPAHILNLKRTLSSKIAPEAIEDDKIIEDVKAGVAARIPELLDHSQSFNLPISDQALESLSQTFKCAAARWMRQELTLAVKSKVNPYHGLGGESQNILGGRRHTGQLQPMHLKKILMTFISLGQFSVLADTMIGLCSTMNKESLLVMVDMANYYHDIFDALGASKAIFRKITQCIRIEQSFGIVEPNLIETLTDLGNRLPTLDTELYNLCKPLQKSDFHALAAACSPISDNMIEAVHSTESDFLDELDHTLTNGSSIDRQTATRVFKALTATLDSTWRDSKAFNRLLGLFSRLQTLDSKLFKQLLMDWLNHFLAGGVRLNYILLRMICSRILALADVLDRALKVVHEWDSDSSRAHLAFEILNLVATGGSLIATEDGCHIYRFCDERKETLSKYSSLILQLFQLAIGSYISANPSGVSFTGNGLFNPPLLNLLSDALHHSKDASYDITTLDDQEKVTIGIYLLEQYNFRLKGQGIGDQLSILLRSVSELNILLSQLRLKAFLRSNIGLPEAKSAPQLARAILNTMARVTADQKALITYLLSTLSLYDIHSIGEEIEDILVSSILNENSYSRARKPTDMADLLKLVNALGSKSPIVVSDTWTDRISDALFNSVQAVTQADYFLDNQIITCRVRGIILLLTLHQSLFKHQTSLQDALLRISLLLSCLLGTPTHFAPSGVDADLIDILYLLSDFLSEDSRSRYTRYIKDHFIQMDSRLEYILDIPGSECNGWLRLVPESPAVLRTGRNMKACAGNAILGQPFSYRRWETMSDATPIIGANDTSLSLVLFDVMKSVF